MPGMTTCAGSGKDQCTRPRLICPPIAPHDLQGPPAGIDACAIREVAARFVQPHSSFGLELKVAYAIEARGLGLAEEDRLRRPYFRLAQEPIIWSWWEALQRAPLDGGEMLALAAMLNGKPVARRQREMFSHGGESAAPVYYETPERARSWIADIGAVDRQAGDPVRKALYRFARIIFAHPFTDGNGRLARAALQAGLARDGIVATPCLALAPVFHLRAGAIRDAFAELGRAGSWRGYFDGMGAVLADAPAWLRRVGEPSPPPSIESAATRFERQEHGRAALLEGTDPAGAGLDPGGNLFGDPLGRDRRLQPDPRAFGQTDQI